MKLYTVAKGELLGLEECFMSSIIQRVVSVECDSSEAIVYQIKKEEIMRKFSNSKLRQLLLTAVKDKVKYCSQRI